jgi:hypothetical protein
VGQALGLRRPPRPPSPLQQDLNFRATSGSPPFPRPHLAVVKTYVLPLCVISKSQPSHSPR